VSAIDAIIQSSVDAVKASGALESGALMGVVSAVGTDGTVTVTRGADVYPKVRLLSGYNNPAVADTVEMLKTVGGWVCLGRLRTAPVAGSVVEVRAGITSITPSAANTPTLGTVTFPVVRGSTFVAQVTANTSVPGTQVTGVGIGTVTSTSLQIYLTRTNTSLTNIHWSVTGVA
jgi:hypothetical protein